MAEQSGTVPERIAKVLSRAGVASRRDAERMVAEGRVSVNGTVIDSPATLVGPADRIAVDGAPVAAPEAPRVWLFHKPAGVVTTARDEKGRQTVFDILPPDLPRVMTVGRLDLTSEGLLILTNDGELKRRMELPETGWTRKYRVRVNGRPEDGQLEPLRAGITIDGERFQPMAVTIDRQQGANAWLTVAIREGRNREVRRAMEAVGLTVNRLIRTGYGPFRLGDLPPGAVEEVRPRVVRDQFGLAETPARAAGGTAPARDGGGDGAKGAATGRARPVRRPAGHAPDPAGTAAGGSPARRFRRPAVATADTRAAKAAPSPARPATAAGDPPARRRPPTTEPAAGAGRRAPAKAPTRDSDAASARPGGRRGVAGGTPADAPQAARPRKPGHPVPAAEGTEPKAASRTPRHPGTGAARTALRRKSGPADADAGGKAAPRPDRAPGPADAAGRASDAGQSQRRPAAAPGASGMTGGRGGAAPRRGGTGRTPSGPGGGPRPPRPSRKPR